MRSSTSSLWWWILSSSLCVQSRAFVAIPSPQVLPHSTSSTQPRRASSDDHDGNGIIESEQSNDLVRQVFPVVSQIHGMNWEGYCRYVNSDLQPQTQLKLTGGTRFDLEVGGSSSTASSSAADAVSITITSFLVFPDGRTRQVQMKGVRPKTERRPSTRLDPVGDGPIYMVLTEVLPDTLLLNEVERETGRIILTTTLSIVPDELIQSSHEIGSSVTMPLEGHQLWRFKKRTFSQASSNTTTSQEVSKTSNQDTTTSSSNNTARDDEARRRGDKGDYRGTTGR